MKRAKRLIAAILAIAVAVPCMVIPVLADAPKELSDIKGHWAEEEMQRLFDLIVITGDGDKYYPNNTISRAEFCTLAGRAFYGGGAGKASPYSDVTPDKWYFKYVTLLTQYAVVRGVGDGTFQPLAPITRQDAAAILERIVVDRCKSISPIRDMADFTDRDGIASYSKDAIEKLYTAGLISGYNDGSFKPKANLTKAEAAVLIHNLFYYQNPTLIRDAKPDVPEVWEHEISTEPLDIYMTAFNKVEKSDVDTRSEYLTAERENIPEIFAGTVVFATGSKNVWINDAKYEAAAPEIYSDDERYLAPAETLAALAGGLAEISAGTVTIGNLTAKVGEKKITIDGVSYDTAVEVRELNGTIYLPIREFAVYKLKKYYSESVLGLAVIADRQIDLTYDKFEETVAGMMAELYLDRPSKDNLAADFEKTTGTGVHPRIFGSKDKVMNFLELAKTDATAKSLLDRYMAYADKFAAKPNLARAGHSDKSNSFEIIEAFYVAYLYTGDTKYAAKAEEWALKIVDADDWGQENYWLDVSFWLLICAEVYDFFYDYLSQETKDRIATQMIKLGLESGYQHYHRSYSDWPLRDNNWNTVCNGGLDIAAAVLYGEGYADDMCLDILQNSFESLSYALYNYAPHGGLGESVHYWEYGTEYVVRVIDAYQNIFGDDYGLIDYPGVLEAPYFAYQIQANEGSWAFHDDPPGYEEGTTNKSFSLWSAYRTGDYNLQRLRLDDLGDEGTPYFYDLYYYMPDPDPQPGVLELDKTYEHLEMAFSRNSTDDDQFWLGIHAHKNNVPHLQWDMGNFVYEAFGVRFATDYGREDYNHPSSSGEKEGGGKGQLFVSRPEGHNLYVINPDFYQGQIYDAQTKVEELIQKPKGAAYKVDLTEAYWGDVTSAVRGYMLTNDRTNLVVQDEISLNEDKVGATIKWFWQTKANAIVNEDKSVTLVRDGFTVTLYFDSNVDYDVEVRKAGPMETSPEIKNQMAYVDDDSKLIEVTINADVKDVVFRCVAEPIGHEMERGKLVSIDEWTVPDGEMKTDYAYADMIYLDGEPIGEFDPNTYAYTVNGAFLTKGYPTVTATSSGKVTVKTNPKTPDVAAVVVESATGAVKVYALTFLDQTVLGAPASGTMLSVAAVEAMDSDSNVPEGAIDRDIKTRWSGATTKNNWIQLDFGSEKEFDALVLSVYSGSKRRNIFDILVSNDGQNWTEIKKDVYSSGTTEEYEIIEIPLTKARYAKLQCYGADTSPYCSFAEIQFWKLGK